MEKNLKKLLVTLCLSIVTITSLSAQELTPYWKERIKLTGETFVSMIEVEPQLANATLMAFALYVEENGEMDELQALHFREEILATVGIGAMYDRTSSFTQYAKNQELKDIYYSYIEKLTALDKTKTTADTEWEKMMKAMQRKGTISQVITQVKKEFEKWATKGDYEKTAQYEHRLNAEGIALFDSLCRAKSIEVWNKSDYGKVSRSKYDADKEAYTYTLTYGDTIMGVHQISGERSVPLEIVSKYSNNDRVRDNSYILEMQVFNGFILPKECEFEMMCYDLSDEMYDKQLDNSFVSLSIPNAKELKICFSDIKFEYSNISNELKQHCFSYPVYRQTLLQAREERERLIESEVDSLYLLQRRLLKQLNRIKMNVANNHLSNSSLNYSQVGEWNMDMTDVTNRLGYSKEKTKEIYLKNPSRYKEVTSDIVNLLDRYESEVSKVIEVRIIMEKLSPIEQNFSTYNKVKNVSCNSSTITFTLPDKTEISGLFHYSQELSRMFNYNKSIYISEQGNLIIYVYKEASLYWTVKKWL